MSGVVHHCPGTPLGLVSGPILTHEPAARFARTMNLFNDFQNVVAAAVAELVSAGSLPAGLATGAIAVEPPRDPSHGDLATNAALILAKPAKMSPRAVAELLLPALQRHPAVIEAGIAGPGFINLRLADSFWQGQVRSILGAGIHYGDSAAGRSHRVNVEYVSANPTGPMHIGHCRGAVFGDALPQRRRQCADGFPGQILVAVEEWERPFLLGQIHRRVVSRIAKGGHPTPRHGDGLGAAIP